MGFVIVAYATFELRKKLMNEIAKTIVFVAVALVSVAAAFVGRPSRIGTDVPDDVGQQMFADMTETAEVSSLEIVDFNEDKGAADSFSIEQRQGLWTIPSHENYPADASENLQAAATMFLDMKVINLASESKDSHADYGVINPEKATGEDVKSAGKLVRIKNESGVRLVEVIVGKEVPESEGQRFVRRPSQDRVYTVAIDADKLSTKFEDWIKQDVIELEAMDIKEIAIRDYSVLQVMTRQGPALSKESRLDMQVEWNADDFKWDLKQLLEFRNRKVVPTRLLDDEELDKDVLDELKNALADLSIVDVAAKPAGLRKGLKGDFESLKQDMQGIESLIERGFYIQDITEEGVLVASTDGEVIVKTNDHVRYDLHFGRIAGSGADATSVNRFVMIAANVDLASIPKPDLQDVPALAGPEVPEGVSAEEAPELTEEQKTANAARDAIIKENERKQNEFDSTLKKAKEKTNQLNFQLADWYYVISEEVYNDIHLSRKDVIKRKEGSAENGFGIDAFRMLEEEGLKREEEGAAAGAPGAASGIPGIPGGIPGGIPAGGPPR